MRTVLVTGCSGLIGKYVCQALVKKNYKVIGIDEKKSDIRDEENFTFLNCPVTSATVINSIFGDYRIDALVHLACSVDNDFPYILDKTEVEKSRVVDKFLFRNAVEKGVKDIILLSTHKVYPNMSTREPINEFIEANPVSFYGKLKLDSEIALQKAVSRGSMTQGIVMRTCPVYAREFDDNLRSKVLDERTGMPFVYGYGDYGYSFTNVKNIADFVVSVLSIGKGQNYQGIYNICDSKPITAKEIVEYEKSLGKIKGVVDQRSYSTENVKSTFNLRRAVFGSVSDEEKKEYRYNDIATTCSNISFDNKKAQRICPLKRKFADLQKE